MKIAGLQKMTLLDYPGKVACTVFLDGCNFRCPFCHNGELLDGTVSAVMEEVEFLSFLEKRRGLLDGVCVSGGEPTVHPDLPVFIERIKALGYSVKLDTNGYRPDVLKALVERKLVDYVAMDIKNQPAAYSETVGVKAFDIAPVEQSILFLLEGTVDYEFRTTVTAEFHNEAAVKGMGEWFGQLSGGRKARRWFLQPFVDRDSVLFGGLHAPDEENLRLFRAVLEESAEQASIRGQG